MPPNSKAHNVVVGGVWVDCYGHFSLNNVASGATCSLEFTPCGWFSYGRYEVHAHHMSMRACSKGVWVDCNGHFRLTKRAHEF